MASKSRKKRNRRAVRKGIKQKLAVGLSVTVFVLRLIALIRAPSILHAVNAANRRSAFITTVKW